jgi:multidrug resistance efflux pump
MAQKNNTKWLVGIIIVIACGIGIYWYVDSQYVYIDKSIIEAPIISLSSENSDILQQVFVKAGDSVIANEPVARVGDQIVKTKVAGVMVSVNQNIGQFENALLGQAVVATMIDPTQLRVMGQIDEDKGLVDIRVGDVAEFTVDAFGSKEYYGVVDEIGQASATSVINNIFNQRPTNEFDIYVRFNPDRYPELKSGMSARLWIYKK